MIRHVPVLVLCIALGACATLDPPKAPQPDAAGLPAMNAAAPQGLDHWWTGFGDTRLDALVEEALAHNLDLRQARARLDEAQARYRLARAARYPGLDFAASTARNRSTVIGPNPLPPGFAASTTDYQTTLNLSWEVDLWGRVAAATRSAGAAYHASQADTAGAQASLAAGVVRSWLQLRAIDAELALGERILDSREESLKLIDQRNRAGASGMLELAQARAERDTAKAALPPLRQARAAAESAIAVLLGRTPRAVFEPDISRGKALDELADAPAVPAGLDAGLLTRRPDVIAASARLLSSEWQLREARAAFFPQVTLTGLLGYESGQLSDLISAPARLGSLALGMVQPIAGIATLRAARDVAAAQQEQNTLAYQSAVINAFRETHDALVSIREQGALEQAQRDRLASLSETARLAQLRFDAGYSGYLDVLDGERGRDAAATALIEARRDRLLAIVDLYLALGGGWSELPDTGNGQPRASATLQ
jgi:outer membrane protein, multidrug efflux system